MFKASAPFSQAASSIGWFRSAGAPSEAASTSFSTAFHGRFNRGGRLGGRGRAGGGRAGAQQVLVYRQGGRPPEMLDCGSIPAEFAAEEWLEKEFALVSGVSDRRKIHARTGDERDGLQLLLSQDESRLAATADNISAALKRWDGRF
ncbi:MAG: hypothetical protein ACLRSW_12865 [Christensenellaceae bacterium]